MNWFSLIPIIVIFFLGYSAGSSSYLKEENQILKSKLEYIAKLEKDLKSSNDKYNLLQKKSEQELITLRKDYENKFNTISESLSNELLISNRRAEYYRQMSNTASNQSRALSDITTRYDKALTEGISLVRELTTMLELRDKQIRELGKALQSDRDLINGNN